MMMMITLLTCFHVLLFSIFVQGTPQTTQGFEQDHVDVFFQPILLQVNASLLLPNTLSSCLNLAHCPKYQLSICITAHNECDLYDTAKTWTNTIDIFGAAWGAEEAQGVQLSLKKVPLSVSVRATVFVDNSTTPLTFYKEFHPMEMNDEESFNSKKHLLLSDNVEAASRFVFQLVMKCKPQFYGEKCTEICTVTQKRQCSRSGQTRCAPGWHGSNCDLIDHCAARPCADHAICHNRMWKADCECQGNNSQCEAGNDFCILQPCLNGGLCTRDIYSWHCECEWPWYGESCESLMNVCLANIKPLCQNGGACISDNSTQHFHCICPESYFGSLCELFHSTTPTTTSHFVVVVKDSEMIVNNNGLSSVDYGVWSPVMENLLAVTVTVVVGVSIFLLLLICFICKHVKGSAASPVKETNGGVESGNRPVEYGEVPTSPPC